ncbi:MAG: type IV pilus modification PilV family protein [Planctomycetota bacterium]|jgi:hypothetical protein
MRRELITPSPNLSPQKTKAGGFTFTEVIVASSLLILAMVPILRALTQAHLGSVVIERRTRCLTLAQTKIDDVKARSIYAWDDNFDADNEVLDGSYLGTTQFTNEATDLKRLIVSVGYDLNGNSQLDAEEIDITLITLVAKRWE